MFGPSFFGAVHFGVSYWGTGDAGAIEQGHGPTYFTADVEVLGADDGAGIDHVDVEYL